MSGQGDYALLLERMMDLAFAPTNDVVRLVFAAGELDRRELNKLELGQIAELKRLSNGTVEVRLIDRLKLMELLAGLLRPAADGSDEGFWTQLMGGGEAESGEAEGS